MDSSSINLFPEYDKLVPIYNEWSNADPASTLTHRFYLDIAAGYTNIVELGVGNGRIALSLAKLGINIIGVDISSKMIEECRKKAEKETLTSCLELIHADIRSFVLDNPAQLIIMPFRTFGHLLTIDEKIVGLKNIYSQLIPGGKFIFDHYIFNHEWAQKYNGVSRLMCKIAEENSVTYVWDTYIYQFEKQVMDCLITVEKTDQYGTVIKRLHQPLSFSWIYPDQVRVMMRDIGFEIENVYGSFDKEPFNEKSKEQIWVIKRPL